MRKDINILVIFVLALWTGIKSLPHIAEWIIRSVPQEIDNVGFLIIVVGLLYEIAILVAFLTIMFILSKLYNIIFIEKQ